MTTLKKIASAFLLCNCLMMGVAKVQAASIDYSFTFTIQTTGYEGLAYIDSSDLAVGDQFQFSFTADNSSVATGSDGTSYADFFNNPLSNFALSRLSGSGSYTPTFTGYTSYVGTYDYVNGHLTFGFFLTGGNSVGWTSSSSSGTMAIQSIFLNFNTGTPVTAGFGTTPPLSLFLNAPVTAWAPTGGNMSFGEFPAMSFSALGSISSVPEPSSLALLTFAGLGVFLIRRKRP